MRLDKFQADDLDIVKEAVNERLKVPFEIREASLKGWNWGNTEFSGGELLFNISGKVGFDIPMTAIANTNLAGKNEVSIEFSVPSEGDNRETTTKAKVDSHDQLMELRMYIPGTVVDEEEKNDENEPTTEETTNAANSFYESLKDRADIGRVAGEAIVSFSDILFLTPRFAYNELSFADQ